MCNHYQIAKESPRAMFDWSESVVKTRIPLTLPEFPTHVYPKYPAPVIIEQGGNRTLVAKQWGVPLQIKGAKKMVEKHVTNARNDRLSSYAWRYSLKERRCLILATGYFEPGLGPPGMRGEILFRVRDQKFFYFAGLWDGDHFTMVTTAPNEYVAKYHDRMPVILEPTAAAEWLGDNPIADDRLQALCLGLPETALFHEDLPATLKITRRITKVPPENEPLLF